VTEQQGTFRLGNYDYVLTSRASRRRQRRQTAGDDDVTATNNDDIYNNYNNYVAYRIQTRAANYTGK